MPDAGAGAHRLQFHVDRSGQAGRSGGVTVWSSAVQIDSQGSAPPTRAPASSASSALPGASCRHATGQASGTEAAPAAATVVPLSGEPIVTTRRAFAAPSSRATHSPATTPPAE